MIRALSPSGETVIATSGRDGRLHFLKTSQDENGVKELRVFAKI